MSEMFKDYTVSMNRESASPMKYVPTPSPMKTASTPSPMKFVPTTGRPVMRPIPTNPSVRVAVPAYGVRVPVPPTPPLYGTSPAVSTPTLSITNAQLDEMISTLKKSINSLKSSWDGEIKRNIDTINNSWVGQDCIQYTSKLTGMDNKVQNTISALELLCSTYEQARDMVRDNQNTVSSAINNI